MKNSKNPMCERSAFSYYDFLTDKNSIPNDVIAHVENCDVCSENIQNLKKHLEDISEENILNKIKNKLLSLHFAFNNQNITCEEVKPFLTVLVQDDIQIKVPTPLTHHVQKCSRCKEDIRKIKKLNFTNKQLYEFGELFTEDEITDQQLSERIEKILDNNERDLFQIQQVIDVYREIMDRENSGVVTEFDALDHVKGQITGSALKAKIKKLYKPFSAAAAVIILVSVFVFMYNPSPVSATGPEEVLNALDKQKRVYLEKYNSDDHSVPSYKLLASEKPAIRVRIEKGKFEYINLDTNKKVTKDKAGNVKRSKIYPEFSEIPENNGIDNVVLPFLKPFIYSKKSEITELSTGNDNVIKYEIVIYSQSNNLSDVKQKKHLYINKNTSLPLKIERFARSKNSSDFELINTIFFEYPSKEKFNQYLKSYEIDKFLSQGFQK